MATVPTPPTPGAAPPQRREITLISHSMLFYWWPIWVIGYIFAGITYLEDHRLAIVPAGSKVMVDSAQSVDGITAYVVKVKEEKDGDGKHQTASSSLRAASETTATPGESQAFKTRISQKAWLGPVFCVILLMTVVITNVPLRGLWSFLVLLLMLILALFISLIPSGWDSLMKTLGDLHIFINMAGYLFIATTVVTLWVVSVFIFDKRTYMVITPGQVQVCEHIGASVRSFDTVGMSFEKQRDDMFRHWMLGFFSGDLIVRTSGAERETIRLPNVLWISWRLEEVQELLREKLTVGAHP